MPDKKLTDNEIVKALEYWKQFDKEIDILIKRYPEEKADLLEQREILKITFGVFDLINHLQADLKIAENINHLQMEELQSLQAQNEEKEDVIQYADKVIKSLQAENERLKAFEDKIAEFNSHIRVEDMLVFASSLDEWLEFCDNLKAEAYKEFAELVHCHCESIINHEWNKRTAPVSWADAYEEFDDEINNFLKELVGEDG